MGALSRQFPFSAHRRRDPGGGERLPARLARMLDAPVRMTDQAGSWALPPDGHLEGFHRDPGRASRLAHGPADDLAGVRGARTAARRERGPWPRWGRASPVNQPSPVRTQSLPPRRRGSDPRARPGWAAPPRSCARSGWERWGAHAGPRWCARGAAGPPGPAGPPGAIRAGHPVAPDAAAEGAQDGVDARRSGAAPALRVGQADVVEKRPVGPAPRAFGARAPCASGR